MSPLLETFVGQTRICTTLSELFWRYTQFLEQCGFNRVAYVVISDHHFLKQDHPLGIVCKTNFNKWDDYYIDQNFIAVDPLFPETYRKSGIFIWQDYCKSRELSKEQQIFFKEAENHGQVYQGATFSVHGPNGTKGVTIAGSDEQKRDIDPVHYDLINLAAYQFHLCYLELMKFEQGCVQPLSYREHTVLQWASTGLTKSGIGDRMNISTHTVDYHMRNIMKKLDAKNTTTALITAIKKGIISP